MGCSKSSEDPRKLNQPSSLNNELQNNSKNQDSKSPINPAQSFNKEIKSNLNNNSEKNELKIDLFPKNIPIGELKKRHLSEVLPDDKLGQSLDPNTEIIFPGAQVPLLYGFYSAHCKHYPLRIKPDDIWLLIIQAFSNHVNINAEELRKYFVNFTGKKTLNVTYDGVFVKENISKEILENFSVEINAQMENYLGKDLMQTLTSDFSTTNYDSLIISKLSIMGAFQKYFDYEIDLTICGIPYIILEGTLEDYQKIKAKAEKLSKYEFDWYINRIIPYIQKMIEAKKGKIDNDFCRNIIKRDEVTDEVFDSCTPETVTESNITGWILDFFAYNKKNKRFFGQSLKISEFKDLESQMLKVPFTINEQIKNQKTQMNYIVGFIGCDQNEKKEVSLVQAWIVAPSSLKEIYMEEMGDPMPPKVEKPEEEKEQKEQKEPIDDPFDDYWKKNPID